jgi:pyruvate dehydrogenase E1 component alpha subunit
MAKINITKETYLKWFESMVLMRKFEEKCAQVYGNQKIKGFLHLYNGQEAVVAGTYSVINKNDRVITAYRDHAHALAAGITPNACMAEMYGRSTGCSKGKGGSMHFFSKEHNFFGGHGIVGGQIPLGAGLAFADKYLETGSVTVAYMGDGAVRQGGVHEAFNMAMNWKLPVVFVCENNGYAMGTSVERTANTEDIYKLGLAYDMPCMPVDGMSCEAVHKAMDEAVDRARRGDGPTFLEIRTYRFRGHSMSDPQKYRSKEEVEEFKKQDPIEVVRDIILKKKWAKTTELEAIEAQMKKVVEEAEQFAENSPWPELSELYTDNYTQADYPFIMD